MKKEIEEKLGCTIEDAAMEIKQYWRERRALYGAPENYPCEGDTPLNRFTYVLSYEECDYLEKYIIDHWEELGMGSE